MHMQISVLFTVHKNRWEHIKEQTVKALNLSLVCLVKKNFLSRKKRKFIAKTKQMVQFFSFFA